MPAGDTNIFGVDIPAIYALRDAWRGMATQIDSHLQTMKGAVAGMSWRGDASFAMRSLWGDGAYPTSSYGAESTNGGEDSITQLFADARDNANKIADVIGQYADSIVAAQKKAEKEAIIAIIVGAVGSLLGAVIPLGFAAGLFRAIDEGLTALSSVITKWAAFGETGASITNITVHAIGGGVINTAIVFSLDGIAHAAAGENWKPTPEEAGEAFGVGAVFGGGFKAIDKYSGGPRFETGAGQGRGSGPDVGEVHAPNVVPNVRPGTVNPGRGSNFDAPGRLDVNALHGNSVISQPGRGNSGIREVTPTTSTNDTAAVNGGRTNTDVAPVTPTRGGIESAGGGGRATDRPNSPTETPSTNNSVPVNGGRAAESNSPQPVRSANGAAPGGGPRTNRPAESTGEPGTNDSVMASGPAVKPGQASAIDHTAPAASRNSAGEGGDISRTGGGRSGGPDAGAIGRNTGTSARDGESAEPTPLLPARGNERAAGTDPAGLKPGGRATTPERTTETPNSAANGESAESGVPDRTSQTSNSAVNGKSESSPGSSGAKTEPRPEEHSSEGGKGNAVRAEKNPDQEKHRNEHKEAVKKAREAAISRLKPEKTEQLNRGIRDGENKLFEQQQKAEAEKRATDVAEHKKAVDNAVNAAIARRDAAKSPSSQNSAGSSDPKFEDRPVGSGGPGRALETSSSVTDGKATESAEGGAPRPQYRDAGGEKRALASDARRVDPRDAGAGTDSRGEKGATSSETRPASAGPADPAPAGNSTRQIFRTDPKTGESHLIKVVRGQRLGGSGKVDAARGEIKPAGNEEADAAGAKNSDYEYHEIDPKTGTVTETHLGPNETVVSSKPVSGEEHTRFGYKNGRRIPIGDPDQRMAVFDHAKGTWDVVSLKPADSGSGSSYHVASPPGRTFEPPEKKPEGFQVLRYDPKDPYTIDLLTFDGPPRNVPKGEGHGDGYEYYNLDTGNQGEWYKADPLGSPKVVRFSTAPKTNRLDGKPVDSGKPVDEPSVVLVRDPESGLYEKLSTTSSGGRPSSGEEAGKSYYRIGPDGKPQKVAVKSEKLDVVKLFSGKKVKHETFSSSGGGTAGPQVDKDGSLTSSGSQKISVGDLRFDRDTGRITRAEQGPSPYENGHSGGGSDAPGGSGGIAFRSKGTGSGTRTNVITFSDFRSETGTTTASKGAGEGADTAGTGKVRFPGDGKPVDESSQGPGKADSDTRADAIEKRLGKPNTRLTGPSRAANGGGAQQVRSNDGAGSGTGQTRPGAGSSEHAEAGPGAQNSDGMPPSGHGADTAPAKSSTVGTTPADVVRSPQDSTRTSDAGTTSADTHGLDSSSSTTEQSQPGLGSPERTDADAEGAQGYEAAPAGDRPAQPEIRWDRVRDAENTLQTVERRSPGQHREIMREASVIVDRVRDVPSAHSLDGPRESAVRQLVAAEIVWAGHRGALNLAQEHFGLSGDQMPWFRPGERAMFGESRFDPARAEVSLGLWSPGRQDEYTAAAAEIAGRHGISPADEGQVRLIAAEIARGYRDGRPGFEAGEGFAGTLSRRPQPTNLEPTGRGDAGHATETATTAAEAHAGETFAASAAQHGEVPHQPRTGIESARVMIGKLSEHRFAEVANTARRIVANVAGVLPSIHVTDEPLSPADELGVLAAAAIARDGRDAGENLVRDLTTQQALTTLDDVPAEYSTQAWFDAGRILRAVGAVPATSDLDGPVAYLDEVFRPRLLVAAALLGSGREAAEQVAHTLAAGMSSNAGPGGPRVAVPTTMRLLDAALKRAQTSLRSLTGWPSLPPALLSQTEDIVESVGQGNVADNAANVIKLLVAEAIYDSGSPEAGEDLARILVGPRPGTPSAEETNEPPASAGGAAGPSGATAAENAEPPAAELPPAPASGAPEPHVQPMDQVRTAVVPVVSERSGGVSSDVRTGPAHTVVFANKSKELSDQQRAELDGFVDDLIERSLRSRNMGLPLPALQVIGYGNGWKRGLGQSDQAVQTGRQRADAVRQAIHDRLEDRLDNRALTLSQLRADDFVITTNSEGAVPARPGVPTLRSAQIFEQPTSPHTVVAGQRPDAPSVPKTLHFIWFGDRRTISAATQANLKAWARKANTAGWAMHLWVDQSAQAMNTRFLAELGTIATIDDIHALIPQNLDPAAVMAEDDLAMEFNLALRHGIYNMASDLARYTILHRQTAGGGVYIDVDIAPGAVELPADGPRLDPDGIPHFAPEIRNTSQLATLTNELKQIYPGRWGGERPDVSIQDVIDWQYRNGIFNNNLLVTPPNAAFLTGLIKRIKAPGGSGTLLQKLQMVETAEVNGAALVSALKQDAPNLTGPMVIRREIEHRLRTPERPAALIRQEFRSGRVTVDPASRAQWDGLHWLTEDSDDQLDRREIADEPSSPGAGAEAMRRRSAEPPERSYRVSPERETAPPMSSPETATPPVSPGGAQWFGKPGIVAGQTTAVPATNGGQGLAAPDTANTGEDVASGPDRLSVAVLRRMVAKVVAGAEVPDDEVQVCLSLVTELVGQRRLEDGRPVEPTGDVALGSAVTPGYLNLPHSRWSVATAWDALVGQVPPGGVTVVADDRPGQRGHAVALVGTTTGVHMFDPRVRGELGVTPVPEDADRPGGGMPALLPARALTVNPDGTMPAWPEQNPARPPEQAAEAVTDPGSATSEQPEHHIVGPDSLSPLAPVVTEAPAPRVGVLRLRGGTGDSIIDGWEQQSALPAPHRRSHRLQRIDAEVAEWRRHRAVAGSLDWKEAQLNRILQAIDDWWSARGGRASSREQAIHSLAEHVRAELGDVTVQRAQQQAQAQQYARAQQEAQADRDRAERQRAAAARAVARQERSRRRANAPLRHDAPPATWPRERLRVHQSASGEVGVYVVTDGADNRVVVKPLQADGGDFYYADNFIRNVGRVATPRARVYPAGSAEGQVLSRLLGAGSTQLREYGGQLRHALSGARHFLVMEWADGDTLENLAGSHEVHELLADGEAMASIGRLMVLDAFLGYRDRMISDYGTVLRPRPHINLSNIMYEPGAGVTAIDNRFVPFAENDARDVLRANHLRYLKMFENSRNVDDLIGDFLGKIKATYRAARRLPPGEPLDDLARELRHAEPSIAEGIRSALAEIGARALEYEESLAQAQADNFPGSPRQRWDIGGLARYAQWRYQDIAALDHSNRSHDAAVRDLEAYLGRTISGPVYARPSAYPPRGAGPRQSPFSPLGAERPAGARTHAGPEPARADDVLTRLLAQAPAHSREHTWFDPASHRPVRSAFDVRRAEHDGERVTELTVIVDIVPLLGTTGEDIADAWQRLTAGVEEFFNRPGHRFPSGAVAGDRLRVSVVRAQPGQRPHLQVRLASYTPGGLMSQHVWVVGQRPVFYAHEIAHQLGARDESRNTSREYQLRGTTYTITRTAQNTGSLMGDFDARPEEGLARGGLRERNLALFATFIGDVTPARAPAAPPAYGQVPPPDYADRPASPGTVATVVVRTELGLEQATDLLRYSWFDVERFQALREQVGGSDAAEMAEWIGRIGRIPDDLQAIADQLPPMRLHEVYEVSREFGFDPSHLPLFREDLNEIFQEANEPGFDALALIRRLFQRRYVPADQMADFVTATVRARVDPEEMRRVLRAGEALEGGEEDLTPAALLRMDLDSLRDLADATLRVHTGSTVETIEEQADRILQEMLTGPQSGKVPDTWLADASAELRAVLGGIGGRRAAGPGTVRLRWALNRARRLVDLLRSGVRDLSGGAADGRSGPGPSTGPGTLAGGRPVISDDDIASVATRAGLDAGEMRALVDSIQRSEGLTLRDLDRMSTPHLVHLAGHELAPLRAIAARLAPMSIGDVARVSDQFGVEADHLWIFGDALTSIFERSRRGDHDPLDDVAALFEDYAEDIAGFVTIAIRAGGITADDLRAVLGSFAARQHHQLRELLEMAPEDVQQQVSEELAVLRLVAERLGPMHVIDVADLSGELWVPADWLLVFEELLRPVYAQAREPDIDALHEAQDRIDEFLGEVPGFEGDVQMFASIAFHARMTADEVRVVLRWLNWHAMDPRLSFLDRIEAIRASFVRLREAASRLAPLSVNDVSDVVRLSGIRPEHLGPFADQLRTIYSRSDEGFDRPAGLRGMFARYAYREHLGMFAELAVRAGLDAETMLIFFEALGTRARLTVEDLRTMPDDDLGELVRDALDPLRTAAEDLAPMSVGDIAAVSREFGIQAGDLWIFGDALSDIYSQPRGSGFDPLADVREMLADYADLEAIRDFASIASAAGLSADQMRTVVGRARREWHMSLADLRLRAPESLFELVYPQVVSGTGETSWGKRPAPGEESAQDEAPAKRPRRDEEPAQAGLGTSTGGVVIPSAYAERFERATASLEALPASSREYLLVRAGEINAVHHEPLPMDMTTVSTGLRGAHQVAALLVAERLHHDRDSEDPLRGAMDLSAALAGELGTRRRTAGAPVGSSRPWVDPYEIGGDGGPSGTVTDGSPPGPSQEQQDRPADPPVLYLLRKPRAARGGFSAASGIVWLGVWEQVAADFVPEGSVVPWREWHVLPKDERDQDRVYVRVDELSQLELHQLTYIMVKEDRNEGLAGQVQDYAEWLDQRERANPRSPHRVIWTGAEVVAAGERLRENLDRLASALEAGGADDEVRSLAAEVTGDADRVAAAVNGFVRDSAALGGVYRLRNRFVPLVGAARNMVAALDGSRRDGLVRGGVRPVSAETLRGLAAVVREFRRRAAYEPISTGEYWREDHPELDAQTREERRAFIDDLSRTNLENLRTATAGLLARDDFRALYERTMTLPLRMKHATSAYHAIAQSGTLSSLRDLGRRGNAVFGSSGGTTPEDPDYLRNDDFVFFRVDADDEAPETRYGSTTIVLDFQDLERLGGWISLHDQLEPLNASPMGEYVHDGVRARTAAYDVDGDNLVSWTYTYRPGQDTETTRTVRFQEEVFHGNDAREGLALSFLREVDLIGGRFQQDALGAPNADALWHLISRLFRPEAKIPSGPLVPAANSTSPQDFRVLRVVGPDGDHLYRPDGTVNVPGRTPRFAAEPPRTAAESSGILGRAVRLAEVLPEESWWRLALDPRDHVRALRTLPDDPGSLYDTEESPGFRESMMDAFREILDVPSSRRLDSAEYRRMHEIVTGHLDETFDWSGKTSGGFAPPTEFPLRSTHPHPEVLTEMVGDRPLLVMPAEYMGRQVDGPKPYPVAIVNAFQLDNVIIQTVYAQSEAPGLVDTVFDRYYEEIARDGSDHDRLRAIGRVVRALQVIHPFGDANRRLNVHVLLPKLLLEQGFKPVIRPDMAMLFQGGYSAGQIADALLEGQQDDLTAPIEVPPAEGEAGGDEDIRIRDWVLGLLAETGPELTEESLALALALQRFDTVLTGEFSDEAAHQQAYESALDALAEAANAVIEHGTATGDTAGPARAEDGLATVVDAALQLVGGLRWRGASPPDPASGWSIGETTRWGHRNHFARWIRGTGPEPNEWSTMNCWEAVLFAAYRAGAVSRTWLRQIHAEAAEAAASAAASADGATPGSGRLARDAYGQLAVVGEVTYDAELMRRFYQGDLVEYDVDDPRRPVIPAGHWIFFNGTNHVGMSLGVRDDQGRQQMFSLWTFPSYLPDGPVDQTYTYGTSQVTTVEELIESGGLAGQKVEYAVPAWEPSPASGASESSAPLAASRPAGDAGLSPAGSALLADLNGAADDEAPSLPMLGRDFFGLRAVPPAPPFTVEVNEVGTERLPSLFRLLDLTRERPPSQEELERLEPSPGEVWIDERPLQDRLDDLESRGRFNVDDYGSSLVMEHLANAARIEMPKVFHQLWVGSVFDPDDEGNRRAGENLARLAAAVRPHGWMVVLWTDLPRRLFQGPDVPEDAARMGDWARRNGIVLLNDAELLGGGTADPLDDELEPFYQAERAKLTRQGYVAASDIGRMRIMWAFGGYYNDLDNELTTLDGLEDVFHGPGFGVHYDGEGYGNSGFFAARRHVAIREFKKLHERNYRITERALYRDDANFRAARDLYGLTSRLENEWLVSSGMSRARRYPVMKRTGPDIIRHVSAALDYDDGRLPRVGNFTMGTANSWVPRQGSPLRAARAYTEADVPGVLRRVIATLVWDLQNRDGDLHLTAVAPVVNGLPDPQAAWEAVLGFILQRDRLARQIVTVTDQVLYRTDKYEVAQVDLPGSVSRRLDFQEHFPDQWVLGERVRRATARRNR
jgi:hypothetical protein